MKVILNVDINHLGEEGDVKNVAAGYARNFLLPRNLVVPYNEMTAALFEEKKAEIEARKEIKRQNARSLKEKLESTPIEIVMPAGANGKLYGAVTSNILVDVLAKEGFEIERKRIEIQGLAVKSVGTYHAVIKLYESQVAEITFSVKAESVESANESTRKADSKKHNTSSAPEKVAEDATAETTSESPVVESDGNAKSVE